MSFELDAIVRELRHGALAAALFVAMIAPGSLDAQGAGTVTGTVTTSAAARAPLRVTFDQKVCGSELPDESVLRGPSGALANAVVTLVGVRARSAAAPTILNEKCRFVPRVQVARPQALVTTTSTDAVLHTTNAQREDGRLLFNVALPVPGMKISKPAAEAGVVRVSCNTHPWMHGWLVVTDDVPWSRRPTAASRCATYLLAPTSCGSGTSRSRGRRGKSRCPPARRSRPTSISSSRKNRRGSGSRRVRSGQSCGAEPKLATAAASVSNVSKISPSRVTSSSSCTRRAGFASFSIPPARATVRLHDTISPMHELSTNVSWPRLSTMFFSPVLMSADTFSFSCPVVSSIVIRPGDRENRDALDVALVDLKQHGSFLLPGG